MKQGFRPACSSVVPGFLKSRAPHIEDGDFSGKSAIVLVTEGKREGNDQTHTFTERLYLDPKTLLPFAKESDGEVDHGETTPLRERWLYTYETLSANQVPEDFFSPW